MEELTEDEDKMMRTEDVHKKLKNLQLALSDRIKVNYTRGKACDGSFEAELMGVELGLDIQIPAGPLKVQTDNNNIVGHINSFC